MISRVYDKLCKYGDMLAREGRNEERRTVHQCEALVHEAYMECLYDRVRLEGEINGLDGLERFKDPMDGDEHYELDNRHFDSMGEIMEYLIDFHNHAVQYKKGHKERMYELANIN